MPSTHDAGTDRIEKKILIHAPRPRVWRALTDPVQFGQWFGAKMPAVPSPCDLAPAITTSW